MFASRSTLFGLMMATSTALAHLQLAWPYALHSPLNPANDNSIKDWAMTNPLTADGTYPGGPYPCKGYINNPSSGMSSITTWSAGQTYNFTIAGTATHEGGSCQLSMSYDQGKTFSVILSIMGGCMIEGMTQEFVLPSDAPSGEALFSWSWFNFAGNREMYNNCAVVTVTNGGSGLDSSKYPTPFVANAGTSINDCVTIGNTEVVFPNPGSNIKYGGATYPSSKPTTPFGFTGTNCVGPGALDKSSGSSASTTTSGALPNPTVANKGQAIDKGAPSSTTAYSVSSATTLYVVPSSLYPSSTTSTAAVSANTQCRRRKRSVDGHIGRKHERLVRRPVAARDGVKRVAAGKAEHISR